LKGPGVCPSRKRNRDGGCQRKQGYPAGKTRRGHHLGENRFHVVENNGGSLEAIAKKYNVGFLALLQANPNATPPG
jgi:hypothetical protein